MQPQFNYFIKISNKSGYITILHATSKVKYLLKHHLLVEGFFSPPNSFWARSQNYFFGGLIFLGIFRNAQGTINTMNIESATRLLTIFMVATEDPQSNHI
jgi:hypothetical protein